MIPADKLGISESLYLKAAERAKTDAKRVNAYAQRLLRGKYKSLKGDDGVFNLAAVLRAAEYTRKKYTEAGIPEKIFDDTFRDVGYWCGNDFERYGEEGLRNVKWLSKHLTMRIFRLGRLQFEFSRFAIVPKAGLKKIAACPCRPFERCIAVHVPQGGKLFFEECLASFAAADAFFAEYYANYRYRTYNIVSWLLDPELKNVLGENSNIVRFASLFGILGRTADSDMNERRVFGYAKDRASYSPRNALERYTLARILEDKPLYSYHGYRLKDKV